MKFTASILNISGRRLVVLPDEISAELPSRGLVMVRGTLQGMSFAIPLESTGKGSHWIAVDTALGSGSPDAKEIEVELESSSDWIEPEVPSDVKRALQADAEAKRVWDSISPHARWDWLRWIRSTKSAETHALRIDKMLSKMKAGTRQACCFNHSSCTDVEVSKSGVLLSL